MRLDLVIGGGTVATASEEFVADVGVADGRIAAVARDLPKGAEEVDASGLQVMPGGGSDGKRSQGGEQPHFRKVPPGLPGLETRLPLLYHEGVTQGRITRQQFVALTATNPAPVYGLYPRKGGLMPGADADIALWKHGERRAIRYADLHDDCDHTPYEGCDVSAWPIVTFSRGEKVWDRGWASTAAGHGRHIDNPSPS
jgi:dihydropyrimidinase